MDRNNHYETAFEAYLRNAGLCYVATDESKKTSLEDEPIKSLDFLVHVSPKSRLLIDVKGRKFPSGRPSHHRYIWRNWCMAEDINALERWQEQFGDGYRSLLVFMYHLHPVVDVAIGTPDLWVWKGKRYLIRAITVHDYRKVMKVCSPRWKTVHLPLGTFRNLVRPFSDFLEPDRVVG